MKKTIKMTNNEIYTIALGFSNYFNGVMNLPIKVGFYFVKNKKYFIELGKQIEEMKQEIYSKHLDSNGDVLINEANKELTELSELEQEVSFYEVSLEDFGDINFSVEQLDTIEFMIKEE